MRTLLLTLSALCLAVLPTQAQLNTTQLDAFNRADSETLGDTPTSPTVLTWSESGQAVGTGASLTSAETIRINGNRADLQAGQKSGVKIATVDMSNLSGYPTTLDDAGGVVTWAFNIRQSKTNPGGFGGTGNGGVLFALASSGSDLDGANAFAVTLGDGDDTDALALVDYNGGYSNNGDFTKIIEGATDRSNEYVSVKVTYDNSTAPDTWTLYARSAANGFPTSDPRTLDNADQIGQVQQDFSGTSNGRKILGALWDHGASSENAVVDDIYVTDPNGRLPVELTSFDVSSSGAGATLTWRTASETNNAGFQVQRKQDGTYRDVGFVEGTGTTTNPQSYQFSVSSLPPGRHTFRLRQEDVDGSTHLSAPETVVVSGRRAGLVQTGPNPVAGGQTASFRLRVEQPQPVTVTLVDVLGRTVRTVFDGRATAPQESFAIDTKGLAGGPYFLHADGRTVTGTQKFTILR